jgi:LEA14-like dessication related protein
MGPMRSRALLSFVALVLCAACRHVEDPNRVHAQLTHQEAAFLDQDLRGGLFRYFARLHGPASATMTRVVWELRLDGQVLDRGETPLDRPFGANGDADFELHQRVIYARDAVDLAKLSKRDRIELTLHGQVLLAQGPKRGEVRFSTTVKSPAPKLLQAWVAKTEGARFSTGEVQVAFSLSVRNPNHFPVQLDGVPYSGMLDGRAIEQGVVGVGVLLAPGASSTFPIAVYLDPPERTAQALVHESSAKYRLRGAMRGELFKIPFDLDGKVALRRGD